MKCISCGAENPAGLKFCDECAAPFGRRCSKCGFENAPTAKFCGECAAPLGATTTTASAKQSSASLIRVAETTAPENLEGERKAVTALFADIKGSTELMRDLDPEEARAIVDPALKLMIDAVHRYDGYVVQFTGDGIFALFGAPVAHEDHPQRAVHAALTARDGLRLRGDDLRRQGGAGVEVRIGINTGEVVMRSVQTGGHTEYSPIGHVINVASRMQSAAPANGIVVSEDSRRLVDGYFELRALGPTELKGIAEPIDVYEVVATGALRGHFDLAARRGLTKFVGRERDLEQLQGALKQATSGHGQIVAVMAEAGTGKSRLYYEFKVTLPAECKVLEAYSVSHGKASAWLPVLELLRKYFGIQDADDAATRREELSGVLAVLDPTLQDTLPYLFGLLGIVEGADPIAQMDPQIKKQRTLDAIKRIVVRESLKQPLIVIFEDLHWIDEQTQALLDLLADSIANARVPLLVNYRPEYRHEWGYKGHYAQIGLKPLGRENAEELLAALLENAIELQPLKRLIIERTGGNPFFIEEMVQALFDEGALVRNGVVKVTRSLSQLRLPPTVQGILAARIDRLSPTQKELLQTMAVIGRESPSALIRRMSALPEMQLDKMLAELRAAEFIYEQPALPDTEYIFKHALTQEVAYNSLLIERRKVLHERAGEALESIFADQLDDHLTQLAHHYSHSDNLDKAVEYLGRAGQQALQRSAYAGAVRNLTSAIDLLQKLPDSPERIQRELSLQFATIPALISIKGWGAPEFERAITRARDLCERLGDPPELFYDVYGGAQVVYFIRADLRKALEVAHQLLQRAETSQDPLHLLLAHSALARTVFHMGELPFAREHNEIALSLDNPQRALATTSGIDEKVGDLSQMSWILWWLGYPDQARKSCNEAVEAARALSHPHSMAFAFGYASTVCELRGEIDAVREIADRLLALSLEHGLADFLAVARGVQGWMTAMQGHEEGIVQLEDCLASGRITGLKMVQPRRLCMLAEACEAAGRFERGFAALTEGLILADENEDRYCEAETYRLRGQLLVKQNGSNAAKAQSCFERAIEIARKQSAKSFELRATMSLARLLRDTGRRDEARTMLATIYCWFTEGFDTADLKDAKALLDELGR
jgi:class 3 adenylate cyclase/predicted ATPase